MMSKVPLSPRRVLSLSLLLIALAPAAAALPQKKPESRQGAASVTIRWAGKPGVERYRLQMASDEAFNDVVYDQAVAGRQHVVTELAPGKYFWRVAPAVGETGDYSPSAPVEIKTSGAVVAVAAASPVVPAAAAGGWRTATGEVSRPVPARLRPGQIVDLVGANTEGTVYAIDGANGVALWTARYNPEARRGDALSKGPAVTFAPLLLPPQAGEANVLAAFDGGVRALRGDTGRELWRARLEGRAAGGAVADLDGDGAPEAVVVTQGPDRFYVIESRTGRVVADKKLDGSPIGAPFPLAAGGVRGVALALGDDRVEIRGADGSVVREEKLGAAITTPPLAVRASGDVWLLLVGSGDGLLALTLPDLKALGRIAADNDALRGALSAADVEGDGTTEIVMVTRRGRVALVSTSDGKVRWFVEGATDASSAAFADLNADGVSDVIVAGGPAFAVGYSGRDGSLIWKVEDEVKRGAPGAPDTSPRSLVVAETLNGGGVVVGSDTSRVGLRAVELPKGALKTAAK